MAKIIKRVWKSRGESGHQVKRVAYGYRIVIDGKPEKVTRAEWTKDDARDALAATAFENAVEAAGLKDFTFHGCRHHFASWFMMRGGQLESLRQILGHKDIAMTLRYAHLSPGHLRAEMNKDGSWGRGGERHKNGT